MNPTNAIHSAVKGATVTLFLFCNFSAADTPLQIWEGNGHSYRRIDTPMTWFEARHYCERHGGYLVTITSEQENEFVYRTFGIDGVNIWLGATDAVYEGVWQWVTGEPWVYNRWCLTNRPQPDDAGVGQDFAIFWDLAPGEWDDNGLPHGDFKYIFICEWDPLM